MRMSLKSKTSRNHGTRNCIAEPAATTSCHAARCEGAMQHLAISDISTPSLLGMEAVCITVRSFLRLLRLVREVMEPQRSRNSRQCLRTIRIRLTADMPVVVGHRSPPRTITCHRHSYSQETPCL